MNESNRLFFVGVYARLSVDGHNPKNQSIDTQINIAKEWMQQENDVSTTEHFELFDIYIDLGKSGQTFERKGFLRLLHDIRRKKVTCVIVKDFSRLGRDYIETGDYLEKIFPLLGIRFVSVTDRYDSMRDINDAQQLGIQLKNLVNDLYAKDIAKRVKIGKQLSRERGNYVGGVPPYGYSLCHNGKARHLQIQPEGAAIVKDIFEKVTHGIGISAIITWLYQEEILTPSVAYKVGHYRKQEEDPLYRWQKHCLKSILENTVYRNEPTAIIEPALFAMVQEIRKNASAKYRQQLLPASSEPTEKKSSIQEHTAKKETESETQAILQSCIQIHLTLLFQKTDKTDFLILHASHEAKTIRTKQEQKINTLKREYRDCYEQYRIGKQNMEELKKRRQTITDAYTSIDPLHAEFKTKTTLKNTLPKSFIDTLIKKIQLYPQKGLEIHLDFSDPFIN
jgi:DNA invertase Pin-like site-specific DNA recombinase